MYKVLLCHRRKKEIGHRAFHEHWLTSRKRLVLELRDQFGFSGYAQSHQLPRRNLIYRAIRATRSWLVTAFFAAKQGGRVPPPPDRQTQAEERWDVIDELSYPSREALLFAMTAEAGIGAARRLVEDQAPRARRTAVVIAEEFVAAHDPSVPASRISTQFFLRGLEERQEMLHYWATSHKELFLSLQSALKYRAYSQLHVRSAAELSAVKELLGGDVGEDFDGVATVTYGGQWELILGFFRPRTQLANLQLLKDEVRFIDGGRSSLVFGGQSLFSS
jgi:hypothetical protein